LVQFQSIDMRTQELLGVFDRFTNLADDYSGVPAYAYGDDKGSNSSRTSSGLSMLMSASARGIKRIVLSTDKKIFREMITRVYDWDLMNRDDESFQGDAEVVATGAVAIMVKEQMAERRIAFLQQTANPVDQAIMGTEGRGVLLRESAKTLEMSGQKVVKDDEDLRKMEAEQAKAAQAAQEAEAAIEQGKLEIEKEKLALDRIRIEGDLEIKRGMLALKERELEVKKADSATKAVAADTKARTTPGAPSKPESAEVDQLIAELGLDNPPEVPGEGEEMSNEPAQDESGLGAPGGDVIGGPQVPGGDGMVEAEPGGGEGAI
jgi:hypothetical protein